MSYDPAMGQEHAFFLLDQLLDRQVQCRFKGANTAPATLVSKMPLSDATFAGNNGLVTRRAQAVAKQTTGNVVDTDNTSGSVNGKGNKG